MNESIFLFNFWELVQPEVVVESGTDKGLGTCVLAAALLRNQKDGYQGKLYSIDVDPSAGWLLAPPYDEVTELIIGDSHEVLRKFSCPIDMFIHDSNHAYSHETGEYAIIKDKMMPDGIILTDNAHSGTALMDFAEKCGARFYFWRENPSKHFYPGGGIGVVLGNRRQNANQAHPIPAPPKSVD